MALEQVWDSAGPADTGININNVSIFLSVNKIQLLDSIHRKKSIHAWRMDAMWYEIENFPLAS